MPDVTFDPIHRSDQLISFDLPYVNCHHGMAMARRNEGGGGQHDDQEHQHDIDQRADIDLIQLTIHAVPYTARGVR